VCFLYKLIDYFHLTFCLPVYCDGLQCPGDLGIKELKSLRNQTFKNNILGLNFHSYVH